ncbi:MAG: type VI secretion system membrane subunit TssM [Deltaproteobacteria bacterium]|nr:type VI secretion system membrane subunit TssM [Deltaproteobacteria bacterium]
MWRYVIALNVLVLLWGVVLIFGLPYPWAIIGTLAIVAVLVALFFWQRRAAKKAAQNIEKDLEQQAKAFSSNVRPDRQAEILEMRRQFLKELQTLKKSKLGGGGMAALYSLPWYMIIGPPGAGKSTALRNSGLTFSSKRGNVRGIGGTRNCDWWLANEAVILDTAGRYAVEAEDRDEWLSFIDTLRKHRRRKPLNGLILAVSITDLAGRSEEEIEELVRCLRERIDEVVERLQMIVPIYLMLTKCDLVPGFMEVFGGIRKEERGQIWGATFPLEGDRPDPGQIFDDSFNELVSVLQQRTYAALNSERRIDTRALMYQFPQQFEALGPSLNQLISGLFAGDVYSEAPILRGVYFTSGTQEGRPVDLLAASVADAFGVSASESSAEMQVASKSYFLRDVFARVMFPDKDVAVRSSRGKRDMMLARGTMAGTALASALLLTFLPLGAYRHNSTILNSTEDIVRSVNEGRQRNKGTIIPPAELESLRRRLEDLKLWEQEAPPIAMRYGMYQGNTIFPALRRFYIQTLQRELFAPLVLHDANEMRSLRQVYDFNTRLSEEEYGRYFDKLKMHLLLTIPRAENEPAIEGETKEWLVDKVSSRWAAALGVQADQPTRAAMEANVSFYLELLQADPSLAIVRDGGAVADTRTLLSRVPYEEAVIKQMLADSSSADHEINIRRVMGGQETPIVSDRSMKVRSIFTRWGWDNVVRERITQQMTKSDHWVLGIVQDASFDAELFLARLRSAYFKQYIEEWRVFLESLRIGQPADLGDSLRMLTQLTRGQPPPLQRLMQVVDYNTHLPEKDTGALGKAGAKVGGGFLKKFKKKLKKNAAVADDLAAAGKGALNKKKYGPDDLYTAEDVAEAFEGFVRFGIAPSASAPPPPSDTGAPAIIPPADQKLPLDTFQEEIAFLRDALQGHLDNPQDITPLLKQLSATRVTVQGILGQLDSSSGWRPRIEALTWPVINNVTQSLIGIKADVARKWCSEVVSFYNRNLAQRFPLAARTADSMLSDVDSFFKPGSGVLWGFYKRELAGDLLRSGSNFSFDNRLGGMVRKAYNESLARYMQRALNASNALFNSNGELRIELDVMITPSPAYGLMSLEVGGESFDYHGGPEVWHHISWPVGDITKGARIRVRARGGVESTLYFKGDWGLFRLIQSGSIVGQGRGSSFAVSWTPPRTRAPVVIEFRPSRNQTDFYKIRQHNRKNVVMFKLGELDPPSAIARGGVACSDSE